MCDIKISYHFSIGLVTSVLGIVAAALDHPEIYLAFAILSMIITSFNLLVLCYFVYTAIKDSMDELHLSHRLGFYFIYTERFSCWLGYHTGA